MNALSMKLDSRERLTNTKEKGIFTISKKCNKNHKKKSIPINVDKDASQTGNGLGCKSDGTIMEINNCKSSMPSETNSVKKGRSKKINRVDGKMLTKSEKVQERLQQFLSAEAKEKISFILSDIRTLSDVEKLYLYLQLPTGSPLEVDPLKQKIQNPLGKKADEEGTTAIIWIQSHLEEDPDVSLPKQEVYDEYQSYCQVTGFEPLCAADFGKVMKQIFPSVKPRRLGTRGNSRYCYSGLRKKIKVEAPALPNIQMEKENSKIESESINDEVTVAACHLLFEWTEKLLGNKFTSLKDLASHLLQHMYVDNRSVAAFTVLLATSPQLFEKGSQQSGMIKCESGPKKSDAQIHLQRKIQEKEIIKEQKRKLQEQRSSLAGLSKVKSVCPKKKTGKSRKQRLPYSPELNTDLNSEKPLEICAMNGNEEHHPKEPKPPDKASVKQEPITNAEPQPSAQASKMSPPLGQSSSMSSPGIADSPGKKLSPQQSPGSSSELEDGLKNKVIIARSKTPVCIAQSLPGIIIVPSLPQMQIAEIGGKPCMALPKYKRIQPKPLSTDSFSSIIRSRASSFGSSVFCKPRRSNDGRRSSHAWLQSDGESGEELQPGKNFLSKVLNVPKGNGKKATLIKDGVRSSESGKMKSASRISESSTHLSGEVETQDKLRFPKNNLNTNIVELINTLDPKLRKSMESSIVTYEDGNSFKRHADETEDQAIVKRPHLENPQSETISVWGEDNGHQADIPSNSLVQSSTNVEQQPLVLSEEEVSVREIEGDAYEDYFPGANADASAFSSDLLPQEDVINGKELELESKHLAANSNEVQQLSQLRMLLMKNLPGVVPKNTRMSKDQLSSANAVSLLMHSSTFPSPVQKSYFMSTKKEVPICESKSLALNNMLNSAINSENLSNWSRLKHSNFSRIKSLDSIFPSNNLSQLTNSNKNSFITDPRMFLNTENETELINANLCNTLTNINHNTQMPEMMSSLSIAADNDLITKQTCNAINGNRVSTYTQVPSVPQSPNTRRRAFNFMPISPRHTPIPEPMNTTGTSSSPVPHHHPRMISTAVGPSQPPSNAGSPFVSPRSTPVPPCRSRHSSGQSTYSTSRHTPFQNVDSGVSSVSSSPFISPQPTPVPVNRLRHNSSHCKTVTFCSINNPQVIHTQSGMHPLGQLRSRHSSGPGVQHLGSSLCSPKSAPLSPLVSGHCSPTFIFPSSTEVRSRHSSGSNMTPMSPVSEQTSPSSSCTSNFPDLISDTSPSVSHSFLNDGAADLLISANPATFRQVRQRHASSSVIYSKPSLSLKDPLSHEVQMLLKNIPPNGSQDVLLSNRSHSVPMHQMLQNLDNFYHLSLPQDDPGSKSHPTTPLATQAFSFSLLGSNQEDGALSLAGDSLNRDKTLVQPSQMEWSGIEGTSDIEMSAARRNLASLLDAPLSDDLQTTLEDLRDCDTEFSKFAQELELGQHEEVSL